MKVDNYFFEVETEKIKKMGSSAESVGKKL